MLLQHNIDRNDAPYNTKAPFCQECELRLPDGTLPSLSVRAVRVQCDETVMPPVRLSCVENMGIDRYYRATFADAGGAAVGYALVEKPASGYANVFIHDANNVVIGQISYNGAAGGALIEAADKSGGKFSAAKNDFVLLPQCHMATVGKPGMAIRVNGRLHTGHVVLEPDIEMHASMDDAKANAMHVAESYYLGMAEPYVVGETLSDNPALNGICKLVLDGCRIVDFTNVSTSVGNGPWWLGGVHLTVRSSDTSNLRVRTSGNVISIRRAANE